MSVAQPPLYDITVPELDSTCPTADHPVRTKIRLKQHQLVLLQRCTEFESKQISLVGSNDHMITKIGIIGDKVGSGKSYVILALVQQPFTEKTEPIIQSYGKSKLLICIRDHMRQVKTNLLVIPHNLCIQWEEHIKRFDETLSYYVISKSKHLDHIVNKDISNYDLIVVTSTFYSRLVAVIDSKSVRLNRVIFDEADSINMSTCISLESNFYWFVTASYGNLMYPRGLCRWDVASHKYIFYANGLKGTGFIKNLFVELGSHVSKDYMKMLVVKNNDNFIAESMALPEMVTEFVICKTPLTIRILHGIVDKSILERLNAGDVAGALSYVDPNVKKSEESIVQLLIDKYHKQISNIELRIQFTNSYEYDSEPERQQELVRLNKRKTEFEEKIQHIKNRISASDTCCICYDDIENKTVLTCCSNAFCFKCINIWLSARNACPLCKQSLSPSNMLVVTESGPQETVQMEVKDVSTMIHKDNDKMTNLRNILSSIAEKQKILIFSSYENTFTNVIEVLQRMEMPYDYLKGNVNKIRCVLDEYRNGNLNVLLVNTNNYGSGLNLENTTDIIMFHRFDNEIEKQVIGRAQRYGRTQPLKVWYLLHENECR
jgi:SNF2 family DNA or RNA helicase